MSVVSDFDTAVNAAIKSGQLNQEQHGAIITAARKVATVMDEAEWPIVRGKIDNVSPAVFLKYCTALGIVPNIEAVGKKPAKVSKLAKFENAKYRKTANG
jgi:hypothetical protein